MNRLSSRKWGMERKSTETDARGESPLSGRSRRSLFAVMMSSSRSVDNSVSDAEDEESFRPRERSGSKSVEFMSSYLASSCAYLIRCTDEPNALREVDSESRPRARRVY